MSDADTIMLIKERVLHHHSSSSSRNNMIALPTMVFALAIVTLFVLAIVACFMRKRSRGAEQEEAASSENYRAGVVVDAETVQSIRLQVISIIFPAGVTVKTTSTSDVQQNDDPESNQENTEDITTAATSSIKDIDAHQYDLEAGVEHQVESDVSQSEPESVNIARDTVTAASSIDCSELETENDENDNQHETSIINRNDSMPECSICLEGYNNSDEIATISQCSHVFHRNCILQWSVKKSQCPICRKDMWSSSTFHKLEEDIMLAKQV